MSIKIDLAGRKFGRLLVISQALKEKFEKYLKLL